MTRGDQPSQTDQAPAGEANFLSRWSRRKQGLGEGDTPPPAAEAEAAAPDTAQESPAPVLRDEDMPALDTIDQTRDVSPFLSEGVSEQLRRQALRRLFALPGFNIRDGLDDYDEDYRSFAALGDIVTSDMKFDQERLERLAAERRAAESREPGQDADGQELAQAPETPESDPPAGHRWDEGDAEEEI